MRSLSLAVTTALLAALLTVSVARASSVHFKPPHRAPTFIDNGLTPAEVTLTGTESIPDEEIKNGNVSFNVTTEGPVTPVPGAPDCPNRQWTEDITDVEFTSATITVEQGGVVVLEKTFAL